MDISPLESFLVLAEEGHMTRAARRLHLSQPAVSAQLKRLEETLGQALFHRTPKGLALTAAGALYRRYVEDALRRLDDGHKALVRLVGLEQGSLALGGGATATTYLLPAVLGRFHERYPAIRLFVREQGSQGVLDAVLEGELDLGVITLPAETASARAPSPARPEPSPTAPPPRRVPQPAAARPTSAPLTITPWVDDELVLIVPPGHPLDGAPHFTWEALSGSSLVLFEARTSVRDLIDSRLSAARVPVQTVMELRSIESIKEMVAQGIGAAFVSRYALRHGERGLPCADAPLARTLGLVQRADQQLSPAAERFRELLLAHPAALG